MRYFCCYYYYYCYNFFFIPPLKNNIGLPNLIFLFLFILAGRGWHVDSTIRAYRYTARYDVMYTYFFHLENITHFLYFAFVPVVDTRALRRSRRECDSRVRRWCVCVCVYIFRMLLLHNNI